MIAQKSPNIDTPAYIAIRLGDLETLDLLLEFQEIGYDALGTPTLFGFYPNHIAVQHNHPHILRWLTDEEQGCALDLRDETPDRFTALLEAGRHGYWACAKILLERGADAKIASASGETFLHMLARKPSLLQSAEGESLLKMVLQKLRTQDLNAVSKERNLPQEEPWGANHFGRVDAESISGSLSGSGSRSIRTVHSPVESDGEGEESESDSDIQAQAMIDHDENAAEGRNCDLVRTTLEGMYQALRARPAVLSPHRDDEEEADVLASDNDEEEVDDDEPPSEEIEHQQAPQFQEELDPICPGCGARLSEHPYFQNELEDDEKTPIEETPLDIAISTDNHILACALAGAGAKLNHIDPVKQMMRAIRTGNDKRVFTLARAGLHQPAHIITVDDHDGGDTCLQIPLALHACQQDRASCVEEKFGEQNFRVFSEMRGKF